MFDAARAGLASETEATRSYNGLIAAFGLQLVKPGRLPRELGRMLNRAEEIRLLADCTGGSVEPEDAGGLLSQAEAFVSAVRHYLDGTPTTPDS